MIVTPPTVATRSQLYAAYNRRLADLLEAQREIARLQQRIISLQTENQTLSYRLAEKENAQ